MLPFMEPIHILGSGSIGMLWASSIRSAFPSYPLAVLFRSHHKPRILGSSTFDESSKRKEVMVCTMQNRRPMMCSVPVEFIDDEDHTRRPPIRNLILATKAYQAIPAVESIIPRLRNPVPRKDAGPLRIFVLSNGALDIRENLQRVLAAHGDIPEPEWIMCTTTHGVVKEESEEEIIGIDDDEVEEEHMIHLTHIGNGRTFLGGQPAMAQLWNQSGLNASSIMDSSSSSDPMEVLLWKKLAGNCFCNPLTALWKVTNGELMQHHPAAPRIRQEVVSEVVKVAWALNPSWPQQELSEGAVDEFVEQLIRENPDNRSSVYHDVSRGRPTEVDSLNGFIVRKGEEFGINTRANEELLLRIRESRN
jgi:2-dehydropantoate 2-reductase